MAHQNLLQLLQTRTIVDCDTMDIQVPKTFGKFVDCTSNQAIALGELLKPENEGIVKDSIALSKTLSAKFPEVSRKQLAVEIAMVKLQLAISHHITGYVHVQTNPYNSYSISKTVTNAQRIIKIFTHLDPTFQTTRICIKIPSTWEGLKACGVLQAQGIATLATTLFTIEQAMLAGEVGCTYIAPYVNELGVHFESDKSKLPTYRKDLILPITAQRLYTSQGFSTQVLPASLTSIDEITSLAGVHHITISPGLLVQLAAADVENTKFAASGFDSEVNGGHDGKEELKRYRDDEEGFRIAFTRSNGGDGEGERKLSQAINIFCDMQDKMEILLSE